MFSPITMIAPNKRSMMPPITGDGIVWRRTPILPTKARTMAVMAAQVITAGLKTFVRATAPVTSEYVVLGGPPRKDANDVAMPSPNMVFLMPGSFI